jgi:8-oxo-dGTP diphosphatase
LNHSTPTISDVQASLRGCKHLTTILICLALGACNGDAPSCTFQGEPDGGRTAGCLVVNQGQVLVVKQALTGALSLPGGWGGDSEPSQCTAQRETWEETGLEVEVGELLQIRDQSFHLYRCTAQNIPEPLPPTTTWEVSAAFFLSPHEFANYDWRFPGQDHYVRFQLFRDRMQKVRAEWQRQQQLQAPNQQ